MDRKRLRNIWDEVEAGLGSGAQFRVLLHLALKPEEAYTRYSLVKATGLRTPAVTEHLERLLELGWIRKQESSAATYQIDPENGVVRLIYELFCELKRVRI